jgi:type VI secretion system protein VasG
MEAAAVFCKLRGNPYVELVHWVHQILQLTDSDLLRILKHFEVNHATLAKDLTEALDRLPRGASSISDLSVYLEDTVERAWVYASLMFGEGQVRSGHIVVGILNTRGLKGPLLSISPQFDRIAVEALTERWNDLLRDSPEAGLSPSDGSQLASSTPGDASGAVPPAAMGKQEALKRFTTDLTEQAREGRLDPIVGRDDEIRQVVDILMRRRQNNPILTGEAGVGKTAVVEGFAQRIVRGDVPPPLRGVSVRVLDVGLLQAGASMKGEFENRLRQVIDEVQSSPTPVILFVDETHTLIGAGGAAGTGDAANLLKPALARGTLRTIGATTWAEYKKYIEKDPALTRRFQTVKVNEPSEEKAVQMMRAISGMLEKHHKVQILDEALDAAVRLSHRYIPARQLPDKAVSLLDTTCARIAVGHHAVPAEVEDSRHRIDALKTELEIIGREADQGHDIGSREKKVKGLLDAESERVTVLEKRWTDEKELVTQILVIRDRLRTNGSAASAAPPSTNGREQLLSDLRARESRLAQVQGEAPLVIPEVNEQAVAAVVADWTGIPVGRMVKNEIEAVLKLADTLNRRVIGQGHAMEMISERVRTSRGKLVDPNKPVGVFLLAGPSGVGKTETALALAEALYGGEQNVITINMSEYQEAHTVSTLKGSPPGYVGFGEGGVLTEAVRRRPYSVVLLDEIEKAHHDVHEIFFQVFDKGWMEDAEGTFIDFKNTVILLTTNAGSELIMSMCKDPELMPGPDALASALRQPLLKVFPAALLGRLVTIPYFPLSDATLRKIVRLQLERVRKRVDQNHKIPFTYSDDVVDLIMSRCTEQESGGRMVDAVLTNSVLPAISGAFLERLMRGEALRRVHVRTEGKEFVYEFE